MKTAKQTIAKPTGSCGKHFAYWVNIFKDEDEGAFGIRFIPTGQHWINNDAKEMFGKSSNYGEWELERPEIEDAMSRALKLGGYQTCETLINGIEHEMIVESKRCGGCGKRCDVLLYHAKRQD